MAADVAALMTALGHERFAIVGHDRGSYVAFRAAMDHPDRVVALTVIGRAGPIGEALARTDWRFARDWFHWFFLGQSGGRAEEVIAAIGPDDWYSTPGPDAIGAEAHEELWDALRDPGTVHNMCEDYRAGLTVDREHDEADRAAGRRVACPVQVLWGTRDGDEELFGGDPAAIWDGWADDVRGAGIDSRHHLAEDAPEATAAALLEFWAEIG
jgi:haloacetate dehalogenase